MNHKHEQAERHVALSKYCAEGNIEARDRMIDSIERAANEEQKVYRVMVVFFAAVFVLTSIEFWVKRLWLL